MLLTVGGDDPDFVIGGLEADPGSADVINDDRIEFLTLEFPATVGERAVAVLGGEADDQLARTTAFGQRREHVGGTHERRFSSPPVWSFLILPACASAGR